MTYQQNAMRVSIVAANCLLVWGAAAPLVSANSPPPKQDVTAQKSAEVAMDANAKRPSIMAQIKGGAPIAVTFDTGSQGAVITRALADKLGLEVIGEGLVGSPEGGVPVTVKVVSLGSLTVGGYAATRTDAVVMDEARLPKGATLIIGNNQFPDARIELDFANAKFRLTKSAAGSTDGWMPLSDRGLTMGTLEIGAESIPLYVDSGNPGWLDIPKSYASKLPLKGPLVDAPEIRLVDRVIPRSAAPLDVDARIGPSALTLRGRFMFADLRFANLGAAALKNARIDIDMPSKKWRLSFLGAERQIISPAEGQPSQSASTP